MSSFRLSHLLSLLFCGRFRRLLCLAAAFVVTSQAQAQWVEETYTLKAGHNAIWLSIDCSKDKDGNARTVDQVFPNSGDTANVDEVWQWNADATSTSFIEQPSAPTQPDSQWKVWKRDGLPLENTLSLLTGNRAYIIKANAAGSPRLIGRPMPPDYLLNSLGTNFVGFPTQSTMNFTNFLSFSEVLKNAPQIFFYDGEAAATSKRLTNPNSAIVNRGQAYWVKSSTYTDYYGPLKVTAPGSNGLDYGSKLTTQSIRLKNVADPARNQTVQATLTLSNSGFAPPYSAEFGYLPVNLRVRGPRDANLEYTYTNLSTTNYTVSLAPGQEVEIVLDANRSVLTVPGKLYASILKISDNVVGNRVDLPVSAVGSSRQGVWVGAAVLNAVNQVETLSGPEFDAPIGTANGETAEVETVVTTTKTTTGGAITQENIADLDFDAAGRAYLSAPGVTGVSVEPWALATTVDAGFIPVTDGSADKVLVQPDNKVLSLNYLGVRRFNSDGTADAGFSVLYPEAYLYDMAIQTDGKIIVGGDFSTFKGTTRFDLGRLNPDGSLDPSFDSNAGTDGTVSALAIQPDGKVLVGGFSFSVLGGVSRNRIGRLNSDGTADTGFDPGSGANNTVFDLAVQADGKILVVGEFTSLAGGARNRIGRLNADGSLDTSFDPPGGAGGSDVRCVAIQSDGKILVGGYFTTLGGQSMRNLGRLNPDGTVDTSFVSPFAGPDRVISIALQQDGKMVIGGSFSMLGGLPRINIGRLNADGSVDTSFDLPGGVARGGDYIWVSTLAVQEDGKIVVGGYFYTTLGGQPRNSLGRINTPSPALFPPATAGTDYTVATSNRAIVTHGGSGYTLPTVAPAAALSVTLTGGGGSGATATATLSAGVASVTMTAGGSGYTSAPAVTFTGDGSGAAGFAVIQDGLVTDVTVTNPGAGYSTPPTVVFTGGGGSGAQATAKITGAVGSVTITAGGSGYTSAPTVVFSGGGGFGAEALTTISGGVVTGVSAIQKESGSVITDSARITYTTSTPAPEGTADGTVTTTSTSTSKTVTLNGKSHVVTRRVSTGGGAAAPSNFPVRLILHSPATGVPKLLQQAYLGSRDGVQYVSHQEGGLAVPGSITALVKGGTSAPGNLGRVSSASFPRGGLWTGTGSFGASSSLSFNVALGYDAETNPFVHTYHPDHDNWNARYEARLVSGQESYTVTRQITLTFDPVRPPGVSELTWGVSTLGGTYTEVITGLRAGEGITVTGPFILQQVSEAPTLTP